MEQWLGGTSEQAVSYGVPLVIFASFSISLFETFNSSCFMDGPCGGEDPKVLITDLHTFDLCHMECGEEPRVLCGRRTSGKAVRMTIENSWRQLGQGQGQLEQLQFEEVGFSGLE